MSHHSGKAILIVEDEALIALREKMFLESAGYTVSVAHTGEKALEMVSDAYTPDLVLMDIDLGGGIDGTETGERLLEKKRMPVVFLSSQTDPEIVARTERITSYGYIQKGSDDTIILASIRMAFDLWEAHQRVAESQALQENLFQQVPGAIYQFHCFPDGSSCFPMASRNIWLVFEVTPEAVVDDSSPVFERIHPEDLDSVIASITRSYETLEDWEHDYRVILPSRGERWLRGRARPERREDGSVLWHGFITDITSYKKMELQVREERRRLAAILDGTNVGTWEWNVRTGETVFNERWAEIIGYTLEELSPVSIETWWRFVHPEDLERAEGALQDHFAGTIPRYDVEVRMRHRDGHWVWVRDRGKIANRTPDGAPEWFFGTHQDVTEEKRRQQLLAEQNEQLERSEARYRSLFENSSSVMLVIDPDDGRILRANPSAARFYGWSQDELTSMDIYDINQSTRVKQHMAEAFRLERNVFHFRHRIASGAIRDVEVYSSPIQWDEKDVLHSIVHDITDRVKLQAEQARLSTALKHSANAVVITDTDGFIEYANPRFEELTQYRLEEVTGVKISIFDSAAHSTEDYTDLWQTILSGNIWRGTFYNRKKTGERYWESASIAPIRSDRGEIVSFVKVAEDITEHMAREQILEETAEKLQGAMVRQDTLMAELNHRVKNNLGMVASLLRLENDRLGDSVDLTDILTRITTISAIHEQLQDSNTYKTVNLRSYVSQVVSTAVQQNPSVEKVLELEDLQVPTKTATTLGLILNEIVTNAVKYGFNDAEPPKLSVVSRYDGSVCELSVTNSGNPFPDYLDLDNTPTLGIRLIAMLTEQLGGEVSLSRTPQPVYTIRFPLELDGDEQPRPRGA
ncbi:MAG: PAS domain S-box protein [Alkalispirochaetaceae bacterium]